MKTIPVRVTLKFIPDDKVFVLKREYSKTGNISFVISRKVFIRYNMKHFDNIKCIMNSGEIYPINDVSLNIKVLFKYIKQYYDEI